MKRINLSKAIVPNSFTAFNILCGFASMILSTQGDFFLASVMIFIAGIFDVFDGLLARMLKTSSQFGVELDSLADVVSFGAAPAMLVYYSHLFQYEWFGAAISSTLLVFGAFRLARFNTQIEDVSVKVDFTGLPIPISAIIIASFVIAFHRDGSIQAQYQYFFIPLILLCSALMVSNVRYNKIPKPSDLSIGEKLTFLFVLIFALLLILASDGKALFYLFLSMVLFGIFRHLFYMFFQDRFPIGNKSKNGPTEEK